MDYHRLMYVLEKVRAACSREFGLYRSSEFDEEWPILMQLVKDGLIREYGRDEDGMAASFRPN